MSITGEAFEWDAGNREKCRKHGVSIGEIEFILGRNPYVAPDPLHSSKEAHFIAVGRTRAQRPVFVAFTLRARQDRIVIRPISARYMHRKEIEAYEAANPRADD